MKTILYDKKVNAIGADNPLPVTFGRDATVAFSSSVYSNDASTARQVKEATSGSSIYITDVVISSDKAMNLTLQDSDGTVVMERVYLTAPDTVTKSFATPLEVTESKALNMLASVDGNVAVTVSGYIA